jgi:hypothetical protein
MLTNRNATKLYGASGKSDELAEAEPEPAANTLCPQNERTKIFDADVAFGSSKKAQGFLVTNGLIGHYWHDDKGHAHKIGDFVPDDYFFAAPKVVDSKEGQNGGPAWRNRSDRYEAAILWALGEMDEFRERRKGEGAYWWRTELRNRAGIIPAKVEEQDGEQELAQQFRLSIPNAMSGTLIVLKAAVDIELRSRFPDAEAFKTKSVDSLSLKFDAWWQQDGRGYDPDTEDVPWFDKRKGLAEYAFDAGRRSR